ncbi:MAG: response regulator [Bdellovibrionaceae bacterium]|nr:response regulator [Pseudobdellovibrionaceae bacterium]
MQGTSQIENLKIKQLHSELGDAKILVVDDSDDNRLLASRILGKFGAQVDLACNGAEGFRKAIDGEYDVVLMDLQMPIMDGYEATRSLRRAGFQLPVVALTAHAMAEDRAQTSLAGFDGHLTKPIVIPDLIQMIRSFLPRE